MPYANHEKQRAYCRTYQKRQRKLLQHFTQHTKKIAFEEGKWLFDRAMENAGWDQEIFDWMLAETLKALDAAETNEFWKQHNEWKKACAQ